MSAHHGGSITGRLGELRDGDQAAAQPLWEHYFSKLVTVARTKLRRMRKTTADQDEEDAALSAFNSFCAGAARGKFPQLADRDDIWRLLVVITARKAMAQANREGRQKRGGGRIVEEAVLFGHGLGGADGSGSATAPRSRRRTSLWSRWAVASEPRTEGQASPRLR